LALLVNRLNHGYLRLEYAAKELYDKELEKGLNYLLELSIL